MYGKAEYEPSAAERSAAESPAERTAAEQILIRERGNREKRLSHSFFSRFRLMKKLKTVNFHTKFHFKPHCGIYLGNSIKTKNFQNT